MKVDCCGRTHQTRFCPDCGRELSTDPIHSLLAYLRHQLKSNQTNLEKRRRFLDKHEPNANERETRIARLEKHVQKWQSWVDIVEHIIDD